MLARDGLRVSTTHALHPCATSTLASAVPEEFNCSFQLGKLKWHSWLICAIWAWFLNQDCTQRLPIRFNLLKPLPSDCLHGNTNPIAPRTIQAHNMLAGSMHTLPWLSTPRQKTTQKSGSAQSHPLQAAEVTSEHPELLTPCGLWVQRSHHVPVAVQVWGVPFPRGASCGAPGWEPAPGPPPASTAQPQGHGPAHPWGCTMRKPHGKATS